MIIAVDVFENSVEILEEIKKFVIHMYSITSKIMLKYLKKLKI